MICKDNSVHSVKEIASHLRSAYTRQRLEYAIGYAMNTKKDLDTPSEVDIIIFTSRDRHFEDLVHARQGGQKVQARHPQAARHAQSASERRDRLPVRNWRFLRSRRCGAGQVRDASPRHCRQAISHSIRHGIRLLTPYLLSSGSGLSAKWSLRAIAREARAPTRAQAHAGHFGLRYAAPGERFVAAPSGLGRCHPRTIRCECSSTEYRTRAEAAGKKTSLNQAVAARKTADPETLISAYEDLRRQATGCSSAGGLGMAIFLSQGMAAWMLACSWVASTNPDNLRRCPITAAPLPDELRGEIVLVLTAMALNQASREVHP